jgi:hypothetical protein
MESGRIPISGIDTDARWGYSKAKEWVFGFTKGLAVQLAIIEMSTAWGLLCYCILYITRLLNTIQIVLRLF